MNIIQAKQNMPEEIRSDVGALEVDSARAVAQIQGAMTIAKKFPRDENQALNRITQAAKRRKVAEQSEYEYTKGGSSVAGPSIRAAETISQAWGNMISGITEVVRDVDKKESLMLAYAADMETNNWKFIEWRVPHTQDRKIGAKNLESGRDIYERVMNDGSRRLRNCLLAVIPGDVTDTFLEECNKTLNSDEIPLVKRLSSMMTAMAAVGVTQPMIENKMGCSFSALTERQLAQLRRIYQSIKDGFGKVGDYFKEAENSATTDRLKEQLGSAPETKKMAEEPAPTFQQSDEPNGSFENFDQTHVASKKTYTQASHADLILEVSQAAKAAGLKDLKALSARCMKDFNKITGDMTPEELEVLLIALEKEKK